MKFQLIALVMAACSSSSNPGNNGTVAVTGSFMTASLAGIDNALAAVVTDSKGSGLDIVLTEGADCAAITAGNTAGATYFELFLSGIDASGNSVAPTAPGTFSADVSSAGPFVEGDVDELGANCESTVSGQFATGTVTVTSLQGGVVSGSIDLANGADQATGTFTTVACNGLVARAAGSGSAACH